LGFRGFSASSSSSSSSLPSSASLSEDGLKNMASY